MSSLYTTFDFIRDAYWGFDKLGSLFGKTAKRVKKVFVHLLNSEFESYVFRIIENLPYGIIILFLGFFLTVTLFRVSEKENGIRIFTITTGSMSPAIKPGSMVLSLPSSTYSKGDIVTYKERDLKNGQYSGRALTHRIIEKNLEENHFVYIAKGDNNENPDPGELLTKDILGKVYLVIPYMGYIDFLIRTVPGFIIFILFPSVLLIVEARRYAFQK